MIEPLDFIQRAERLDEVFGYEDFVLRIERRVRCELAPEPFNDFASIVRFARSEAVYVRLVSFVRGLLRGLDPAATASHGMNLVIRDCVREAAEEALRLLPHESCETALADMIAGVVDRLAFVLLWEAKRMEVAALHSRFERAGALAHEYGYTFLTPERRG